MHIRSRLLVPWLVAMLLMAFSMLCSASLFIPAINRTFAMYDMYGETDQTFYNFTGPLVLLRFKPEVWCTLDVSGQAPPPLIPPAQIPLLANSSSMVFVFSGDMHAADCPSFASIMRQFPSTLPTIEKMYSIPPVRLAIFTSSLKSDVEFGSNEEEPFDDYWTARPPGLRTSVVALDSGYILRKFITMPHPRPPAANSTATPAPPSPSPSPSPSSPPLAPQPSASANSGPPPAIVAHAIQEIGPWNEYIKSTYYRTETILLSVLYGLYAAYAAFILLRAAVHHTLGRWFKTISFLCVIQMMVMNLFCQERFPMTRLQRSVQFATWLIGNIMYTCVVVKWAAFMRRLCPSNFVFYMLVAVCVINIIVFSVAMIVLIVGLYSKYLSVLQAGLELLTKGSLITFGIEALYVLVIGFIYMTHLNRLRVTRNTLQLLKRETASLFVFFVGRTLMCVSLGLLGAGYVFEVGHAKVTDAFYHAGVLVVYAGILWALNLQDYPQRRQEAPDVRSSSITDTQAVSDGPQDTFFAHPVRCTRERLSSIATLVGRNNGQYASKSPSNQQFDALGHQPSMNGDHPKRRPSIFNPRWLPVRRATIGTSASLTSPATRSASAATTSAAPVKPDNESGQDVDLRIVAGNEQHDSIEADQLIDTGRLDKPANDDNDHDHDPVS